MDWHRTGERTHVIYRVSVMGHLLAHIYFHLNSWQLALSSFGGSGSEALGRARPLPEVMQLVSGAEFEPSLWKPHHTDSIQAVPLWGASNPSIDRHLLSTWCQPVGVQTSNWTLPFSSGQLPACPSFHCAACTKGAVFFMSPSSLLWHETQGQEPFLTFFSSSVPGT